MAVSSTTIDEAVRNYLTGLSEKHRTAQDREIMRFVRYFGPDVKLSSLRAEDIERYQEQVAKSGADATRLEVIRGFLAGLYKLGETDFNLGKFIKIKRSSRKKVDGKDAVALSPETEDSDQITREGFADLKTELEFLSTTKREEIAHDLYEARIDKDFRENAPYDAAKQHQAEVENRIRQLEHILATSQIVDNQYNGGRINIGTVVVLRDMTHDEVLTYTLVGTSEANPRAGRISVASPVGRALLDRSVGDEIEVEAPLGKMIYRVEKVQGE